MRYFRQIVPQVFFRAGASILKWKELWCQCGTLCFGAEIREHRRLGKTEHRTLGPPALWSTRTTARWHLNMQQSQRLVKVWFRWLLTTEIRKAARSSQTKCAVKVGKSNSIGGATCPAADRYRCPNSTRSPHAPVTQNINLLSPGCLFYPDLNSTLFHFRFDWVSGETVNKSKESITALLYTWKLSIF